MQDQRPRQTPPNVVEGRGVSQRARGCRGSSRRAAPGSDGRRVDGAVRAPPGAAVDARVRRCVRIWSITDSRVMNAMSAWAAARGAREGVDREDLLQERRPPAIRVDGRESWRQRDRGGGHRPGLARPDAVSPRSFWDTETSRRRCFTRTSCTVLSAVVGAPLDVDFR